MNLASNGITGGVTSGPWQNQNSQNSEQNNSNEWICDCGTKNNGKFCSNCGKEHNVTRKCPKC